MSPYGSVPPGAPRFGELRDEYDAFRTGYTRAIYDHLARHCGLVTGADVVDLGCGTGISTGPLLERGARVVGVDPDPAMLDRAAAHLGDEARLVLGRAEQLPLPDASADLVVAAQAAHWFQEPQASAEIHRVLRPGGSVAYLWKYPTPEMPYVYLVDELLASLTGDAIRSMYGVGTVPELLQAGWRDYRRETFEQPVPYTIESYVGWVSSRERIRQIAGEKREQLLTRLGERLEALVPSRAFVERNLAYVISARRDP